VDFKLGNIKNDGVYAGGKRERESQRERQRQRQRQREKACHMREVPAGNVTDCSEWGIDTQQEDIILINTIY